LKVTTEDFYDKIAPFYDLIYHDWENSITQQAGKLASIINASERSPSRTILDVWCEIGTQAIGLAKR
jgi:ubiquinone/menaquinone biosynthesis C-methylase UbiE